MTTTFRRDIRGGLVTILEAYQTANGTQLYLRPTNKNAVVPDNLANKGVVNTEDAAGQLWIPPWDWYLDNKQTIDEKVNAIFGTT